jgi:hypothetical protein
MIRPQGASLNPQEFQVCCAILDDHRKLIAAGKVQRWDVLKWAVTVNVALATASIALKSASTSVGIVCLAALVAFVAGLLILHYNNRLKNARNDSIAPERYLMSSGVDFVAIAGKEPKKVGFWYDRAELVLFAVILVLSVVPTLVVWIT